MFHVATLNSQRNTLYKQPVYSTRPKLTNKWFICTYNFVVNIHGRGSQEYNTIIII